MKNKELISRLYKVALLILFSVGFIACNADKDTEVAPKTLEEYTAELANLVSIEKPKVQNMVVGYNKGDFKSENNFEDYSYDYMRVIVAAEAVLADPEISIEKIVYANLFLSGPGKQFNDQVFQSDRRELNNLIGISDTLYVHTPAGTEPGMAPEDSRVAFKQDINEAKSVRDRMSAIERQITEAVDSLTISLEIFEEAIIK